MSTATHGAGPGRVAGLLVGTLALFGAGAPTAAGQRLTTVGTCRPSLAEAYLDVGDVRARILNDGSLFYRGEPHVYEVPQGGGVQSMFAASIWLVGHVAGTLRVSATLYGPRELWPGPIPETGVMPRDCSPFDRIWTVRREEIERLNDGFPPTLDILDWPASVGAPVVDGDGNPTNYDVAAGDRPEILGDQMAWTLMNDRGNVHNGSGAEPLGVEVRQSAVAFSEHAPWHLDRQTLYRFRIRNRGDLPILDARFGMFVDADLGNFDDDYVGVDTALGLAFFYNADDFDEPMSPQSNHTQATFGEAPPAIGVVVVRGPRAPLDASGEECGFGLSPDRLGLSAMVSTYEMSWEGPWESDFERWLSGLRASGRPFREGGVGLGDTGPPTRFLFPGDPVTRSYWSEMNSDGAGTANTPGDRRFVLGVGPFCLPPGGQEEVVLAVVWARGRDHLDSVALLRETARRMLAAGDGLMKPLKHPLPGPPPPERFELAAGAVHPNPASDRADLRYSLPHDTRVRIAVYDLLGRERATLVDAVRPAGAYSVAVPAAELETGAYLVRIEAGTARASARVVVVH